MCMTNVSYTNIQDLVVVGSNRRLMGISWKPLSSSSIIATYTVVVQQSTVSVNNAKQLSYTFLASQLSTAIQVGEFNLILQSQASQQGVSSFTAVTSSSVSTFNDLIPTVSPTLAPTYAPRLSSSATVSTKGVAGIVIAILVVVVVIMMTIFYCCCCDRKQCVGSSGKFIEASLEMNPHPSAPSAPIAQLIEPNHKEYSGGNGSPVKGELMFEQPMDPMMFSVVGFDQAEAIVSVEPLQ